MAKKVFDNHDLVCLIYSFGSPDHRVKMRWIEDSLLYPDFHPTDEILGKCLLSPIPNLMKHHIDWGVYIDFFMNKRCRCCSRHSHRKPNIYMKKFSIHFDNGDKSMVPEAIVEKDCECECRHRCRKIIKYLTE
jgi:hypothetical protein